MDKLIIKVDERIIVVDGTIIQVDGTPIRVDGRIIVVDGRIIRVDGRIIVMDEGIICLFGNLRNVLMIDIMAFWGNFLRVNQKIVKRSYRKGQVRPFLP